MDSLKSLILNLVKFLHQEIYLSTLINNDNISLTDKIKLSREIVTDVLLKISTLKLSIELYDGDDEIKKRDFNSAMDNIMKDIKIHQDIFLKVETYLNDDNLDDSMKIKSINFLLETKLVSEMIGLDGQRVRYNKICDIYSDNNLTNKEKLKIIL
mgnify:CR=1 FL=1